jgi:ATP-binding cassette subfamily C protein
MNSALAPAQQQPASSELAAALGACRRAFVATAVFSGMSNLLMLTGALFMLEVYDRILPSRSVPTLVALLFLVAGLYAAQGMIDTIRSRILVRVGHSLAESMSGRVYDAIVRLPLRIGGKGEGTQPIATWIMCAAFFPEAARWRSLICRGCPSISRSVFCFIP